jgi:hypothetical protein
MKIGRHIIRIVNFLKCILINVQGRVTNLGRLRPHCVFFINCLLVCLLSAQPSDCSSLSSCTRSIMALHVCS